MVLNKLPYIQPVKRVNPQVGSTRSGLASSGADPQRPCSIGWAAAAAIEEGQVAAEEDSATAAQG